MYGSSSSDFTFLGRYGTIAIEDIAGDALAWQCTNDACCKSGTHPKGLIREATAMRLTTLQVAAVPVTWRGGLVLTNNDLGARIWAWSALDRIVSLRDHQHRHAISAGVATVSC